MLLSNIASAHDPQTDPELAELNDYMMAIQSLRHSDSGAESLFKQWQTLREESWKIRELTNEQNLNIGHPEVEKQVQQTNNQRKQLLSDSRSYFSGKMDQLASVQVQLGDEISISDLSSPVEASVGSRQVILVEFLTDRAGHCLLYTSPSPRDRTRSRMPSSA